MVRKKGGRRKRSRNQGFWFRKGRGWYVTVPGSKTPKPLGDEAGRHLKAPEAKDAAKRAYHAWETEQQKTARRVATGQVTIREVCEAYVAYMKQHQSIRTYAMRGRYLWDFCTGFPAKYWGKEGEPPEKDRIHPGYGDLPALRLTRADVRAWVAAHQKWTTNRAPAAAVLRALNYAVKEVKLLASNPIRGFPLEKAGKRRTYFTEEVQQAMERDASAALALAVKVGIRTGCRPIIEYASLEARHVEETPRGQLWRFPKEEAKGRQKERVIYVAEEIAQVVRQRIKISPTGKLFRDDRGNPWTVSSLGHAFRQLRDRLRKAGVEIDDHDVMYTARHTFAKRMLMGYWGKQVSLEVLAGLMGNTPKICWEHYAHFVPSYVDPFWDAINGGSRGSSPSAPSPSSSPAGAAPVDTRRLPLGARGRTGQATPS